MTITFQGERAAIESVFFTGWDSNTTPVKLDNILGFIKGTGTARDETKLDEWCHLSIIPNTAIQADMNEFSMVRYTGTIVVNIFVKAGTGTDRARKLATDVISIFQLKNINSIITRAGILDNGSQTPDGSFYQVNVRVPYYRDQYGV